MIVRNNLSLSRVARYVGRPLLVHTVFALIIVIAHDEYRLGWLAVPSLPVSILAATLGILLSFRNNSGYDRWWEARTVWGGVVNSSRTFARRVLTMLPDGLSAADDGEHAAAVSRLLGTACEAPRADDVVPSDGAVRDRRGVASHSAPRSNGTTALLERRAAPAVGTGTSAIFGSASAEARELVYAQIGFVNALRCHLRRQPVIDAIVPFFRPEVVEALKGEQNVPAAILVWMGTRVRIICTRQAGADGILRFVALDETITELTNLLGACERIKNTPIPRQYEWLPRVMTRAYLALLPLGVVGELGYATPFVTAIIAFLFISLDGIGRNIEAPFENDIHDTPMTALSRTIEINLRQMLGEPTVPPALQPVDGYLF